jgi:hypothetical protein
MSSIKCTAEDAVEALLNLDEGTLDEDQITKLQRVCATEEERKLIGENAERILELSPQEQFMHKMFNVPGIEKRLECLLFKVVFDEHFVTFNRNLEYLKLAHKSIGSPLIMELIAFLLKVGNYLNQGTPKGNSVSF